MSYTFICLAHQESILLHVEQADDWQIPKLKLTEKLSHTLTSWDPMAAFHLIIASTIVSSYQLVFTSCTHLVPPKGWSMPYSMLLGVLLFPTSTYYTQYKNITSVEILE